MTDDPTGRGGFSFAKLVFYSLGAGALVLFVSIPIILLVARWSAVGGLVVALLAVVGMITAIGIVSRRVIASAERTLIAQRDARDHSNPEQLHRPGTTDRNTTTDG